MLTFLVDESEDEVTIALAPNLTDCESVPESVSPELHENGSYYKGIVTDLEETLLCHKQATITEVDWLFLCPTENTLLLCVSLWMV